jgi:hypothetical protein
VADVDQFGRPFTHDVHADQSPGLQREQHLHEARRDAHDVATRGLAEPGHAALVGDAPLARLLLVHADRRDLRHRIDAIGEELRRLVGRGVEGMAGGDPALLHRGGGQAREADDVAARIDVRLSRLERRLVHGQAAALIGLEAASGEVQAVGAAFAAGREQYHVGA